ncbi:GSCFA domain-containing protein [Roseospira marina]|nr:GSCFA domain-containing protein [Roseospira marina]MBB4312552.1 hypothetical protein [Roseospira marina]MBB5085432.1 hypothetical protein [Roseospira marina]
MEEFIRFFLEQGVRGYAPDTPIIDRETRLVTIGSCFSAHVAQALGRAGLSVTNYEMSERIFSTFALREFLDGLIAGKVSEDLIDDVPENRANIQGIRDQLEAGATVIVTLGLAACWFEVGTDRLVHTIMPKHGRDMVRLGGADYLAKQLRRFEMRLTTVQENAENLRTVIRTIQALNPDNQIVLTVSPVPLQLSYTDQPMLTSDFHSKATLRMAVSEIEAEAPPKVYYYPSFEIVRWAAPHLPFDLWGSPQTDGDPRHIDPGMIELVIKAFLTNYARL